MPTDPGVIATMATRRAAGGAQPVVPTGLPTRTPRGSSQRLDARLENLEPHALRDLFHVGAGSIEEFEFLTALTDFFTDGIEHIKCSSL